MRGVEAATSWLAILRQKTLKIPDRTVRHSAFSLQSVAVSDIVSDIVRIVYGGSFGARTSVESQVLGTGHNFSKNT